MTIGINNYPNAQLLGCVNDSEKIANTLYEAYGVRFTDIYSCTDERARTVNMVDRLNWFVENLHDGWNLWHYSGHGAQYPTYSLAEKDGYGECLCPVDYDGRSEHRITDVQFGEILAKKRPEAKLLLILDSCFSGGMDRGEMDSKSRLYPASIDPTFRPNVKLSGITRHLPDGVIMLTGASEDQTAADAVINGERCGPFTYFLCEALAVKDVPLAEVMGCVTKDLADAGFSQVPQILGDYKLFDEAFGDL